jgi:ketol-acid reductoisomerase
VTTKIYYERDAAPEALAGSRVAVVGYGNQGRSWALNLRDSGASVLVCVRRDETRERAEADGFSPCDPEAASEADVVCLLVPDDAIPTLPLERSEDGLTIVASGYTLAFGRLDVPGDLAMIAPRMLGPEVRRCYQEGVGFISALGVQRDATGRALGRTLAVALGIGALRQGAIAMTPSQEAVLDLAVEQVLSPALALVNEAFVREMLREGIPLEAVMAELTLSGEVERTYRLLREIGFARQMEFHSPTSQYGQLSRRGAYDHLDPSPRMRELVEHIVSGRFADEWERESRQGHPTLAALKERYCGRAVRELEDAMRRRLGPRAGAEEA